MERLRGREIRRMLAFLRDVYLSSSPDDLRATAVRGLAGLVPAELTNWVEVDPATPSPPNLIHPDGDDIPRIIALWERHLPWHPVMARYQETHDGRPVSNSDLLSRRRFRALRFYGDCYRPIGVEDCMGLAFRTGRQAFVGIGLARSSWGFTERERLTLDLLRPHLASARQNALAATAASPPSAPQTARMVVDEQGRITTATPAALAWLGAFCGARRTAGTVTPELREWARETAESLADEDDVPRPPSPLVIEQGEKRLEIRLLQTGDGTQLALQVREPCRAAILEELGLTPREAEVLSWVVAGKGNADIAALVGASVRTVEKHLEHILEKLGVENRTAAALCALDHLHSREG